MSMKTLQEYGLDGMSQDINDVYHGLQAKCYTKGKLCAHHLGTFYQVLYQRLRVKNSKSLGYLYATCGLQVDVRDDFANSRDIMYVKLPFPAIAESVKDDETKLELYDFQKEAVQALLDWDGDQGLLSMPCSTGKTLVLGHFLQASQPKVVIVLSPTRQLTEQNHSRLKGFLPDYKHKLVSCDATATRDITELEECLSGVCRAFLSSTYKSLDVISEVLEGYGSPADVTLCIDECHNITKDIQTLLDNFEGKVVMLSATPPDLLDVETIYTMKFQEAIQKQYITDYRVYIPTFGIESGASVELEDLDGYFAPRAEFLATGMLLKGSRRCIVYLNRK